MGLLGGGPDIMAEIGLDARGFILGARQVETSLTYLSKHPIFTAGAVTAALGGAAVNAAVRFEDALAGVAKTMNLTAEETAEVGALIRDLSREKPFKPEEIAGVAQIAGQLGIARESLVEFTSVMLDMGATTDMTAADAADAFARFAAAAGVPQDQFDEMASTVVHLGNNLAATESEIIKMAFRIAGAGKTVGLTTPEILALSAGLSSLGVKAEMGGSSMSRILKTMHNAVNGTTRESKASLESFASVAGTSAENFARVWQSSPQTALLQFLQGLTDLEEAGTNLVPVLDELGLKEIRVSDVTLRAKNGQETLKKALALASVGWQENTALTTEAERRYATTASQLRLLGNDFKNIAIEVGDNFLPALRSGIAGLREFIANGGGEAFAPLRTAFENLGAAALGALSTIGSKFKEAFGEGDDNMAVLVNAAAGAVNGLAGAITLLAVPAGVVAGALGAILAWATDSPDQLTIAATAIGALTAILWLNAAGLTGVTAGSAAFAVGMGVMTAATWLFNTALGVMDVLLSPIVLVVLGIAAAIATVILVWRHWDEIVVAFNASMEWLGGVLSAAGEWLSNIGAAVWEHLVGAWDAVVSKVTQVGEWLAGAWASMVSAVTTFFAPIGAALGVAWDAVKSAFSAGVEFVKGVWQGGWDALVVTLGSVIETIKVTVAAFFLTIYGIFTGDTDLIKTAWDAWGRKMTEIGGAFLDGLAAAFSGAFEFLTTAWSTFTTTVSNLWSTFTGWVSARLADIVSWVAALPGKFFGLASASVAALKDGAATAWTTAKEWFVALPGVVIGFVASLPQMMANIGGFVITGLKNGAMSAWETVKFYWMGLGARLIEAAGDIASLFRDIGRAIVNGIRAGITEKWSDFKEWFQGRIRAMKTWAEGVLDIHSPSRVFAGIGANVVAGFEEGLEPLGLLMRNGRIEVSPITMNGAGEPARGGAAIGTLNLTVYANDRRGGDDAARAIERRLMRLGVLG